MSKSKNKKHYKLKKNKKKKKIINMKSDFNKTSLSKHEVSANWLNFKKLNSLDNKVFNREIPQTNVKTVRIPNKKKLITKVLALDCEMVSDLNNKDMLARVSVVNYKFECIYDKYVKPTSPVGDYRTRFSGIREKDLEKGENFDAIRSEVKALLYNKILVGHALHNDFKVLEFGHHKQLIRDTAKFLPFREVSDTKSPSLKKLAKVFLNENIQEGEHNSIEDAKTAMKLYKKFRQEWELSFLKTKKQMESQPGSKSNNTAE